MAEDDAQRQALAVYAAQFGIAESEVPAFMAERFGTRMTEAALAAARDAWASDSPLTARERSLLVVAALTAQGVETRLWPHVRLALKNGLDREELEAAVAFLAVYVGYPRASVAMEAVREALSDLEPR